MKSVIILECGNMYKFKWQKRYDSLSFAWRSDNGALPRGDAALDAAALKEPMTSANTTRSTVSLLMDTNNNSSSGSKTPIHLYIWNRIALSSVQVLHITIPQFIRRTASFFYVT